MRSDWESEGSNTPWGAAISKQVLETLHFIAFAAGIGAIMVVSLRLLGLGRSVPIAALSRPALRIAWFAFAAVLATGVVQFIPIAAEVLARPSFQAKIAVLAVALAVLVLLEKRLRRDADAWDAGAAIPHPVMLLAALSLVLWPTVIVVARLMYAFVQMAEV